MKAALIIAELHHDSTELALSKNDSNGNPAVSIIIRTIGRPELQKALGSVEAQTFDDIEVIVVDATGEGIAEDLAARCSRPAKVVRSGTRLRRSAAANAGLRAAGGDYLMLLDDDDWLLAEHVQSLVNALESSRNAKAAYSGIACRKELSDGSWETTQVYNERFNAARLLVQNYIPIHAMLFHSSLVENGSAFDETLEVFEDWDFWLQLAQQTAFIHVDKVSAIYRIGSESGFGAKPDDPARDLGYSLILAKWAPRWTPEQLAAVAAAAATGTSPSAQLSDLTPAAPSSLTMARLAELEAAMAEREDWIAAAKAELFEISAQLFDAIEVRKHLISHLGSIKAKSALRIGALGLERRSFSPSTAGWFDDILSPSKDTRSAGLGPVDDKTATRPAPARTRSAHGMADGLMRSAIRLFSRDVPAEGLPTLDAGTGTGVGNPAHARNAGTISAQSADCRGLTLKQSINTRSDAAGRNVIENTRASTLSRSRIFTDWARRIGKAADIFPSEELLSQWARSDWPDYDLWLKSHAYIGRSEWEAQREIAVAQKNPLRIAIIAPLFNPEPTHFLEMVLSVRLQSYPHWTLHLIDDASTRQDTLDLIHAIAKRDRRISLATNHERLGISRSTNIGIARARERYLVFLDHDDRLTADALWQVARELNSTPDLDLVYADRDMLAPNGCRIHHHLKPDWSPELLLSGNYLFHLVCYRASLVREHGGYDAAFDGSQDYDLALRLSDQRLNVRHISKVLYQWRQHERSISLDHNSKSYVYGRGLKALRATLKRRTLPFRAEPNLALWPGNFRLIPENLVEVKVISIPTRLATAEYSEFLNSAVAERVGTEFLVVVSEAMRERRNHDARRLGSYLLLPGVAFATGRVLTDSDEFVHGGLVLGRDGIPRVPYLRYPKSTAGYMACLALLRNVSAPWPWCFAFRRSLFLSEGGLDPRISGPFAVLDLALRLRVRRHKRCLYAPEATFIVPSGSAPVARPPEYETCPSAFQDVPGDAERFSYRWRHVLQQGDPYLNAGLDEAAIDLRLDTASAHIEPAV